MAGNQSDFVMVRLTERGRELAGNGVMTFANGRRNLTFQGKDAVKVERSYEWNFWLRDHHTPDGRELLEIADDAEPAATAAAAVNEDDGNNESNEHTENEVHE
ncbi:MAG TPA: hypothetical protein VGN16_21185 [Acidobacteriaceae bacterium]